MAVTALVAPGHGQQPVRSVSSVSTTSSPAVTFPWDASVWNFPHTTSPIFEPVMVFPRPVMVPGGTADPGQPNPQSPIQRPTGAFGFTDHLVAGDPNDDREYFISCRSDGIFVIDATPDRTANPFAPGYTDIPVGNTVLFVAEPPPHPPSPLLADLQGLGAYPPYFPSNPGYLYDSRDTPNREAVAYEANGTVYVYSVNTWHDGIWVLPLVHSGNGSLIRDASSNQPDGYWVSPAVPPSSGFHTGTLGPCHTIYLDARRGTLFVATEDSHCVFAIDLSVPGDPGVQVTPGVAPVLLVYDGYPVGPPHDAMPSGNALYVSTLGTRSTHVYDLPLAVNANNPPPKAIYQSYYDGGHSCYVDPTASPKPSIWLLAENMDPVWRFQNPFNLRRHNMDIMSLRNGNGIFTSFDASRTLVPYFFPKGIVLTYIPSPVGPVPQCSPVHQLRGVGRTGFTAQYCDGVSLLDLSEDPSGTLDPNTWQFWKPLGTFDTTSRRYAPGTPGNWSLFDNFQGAWDIAAGQDSGLLYVPGGINIDPANNQERMLSSIVLRAKEGHCNRYWHATMFPSGAAAQGLFPRILPASGPPRAGRSFTIKDGCAASYPRIDALGNTITYQWSACIGADAPGFAAAPVTGNPAAGGPPAWDPDPASGQPHNNVWFNLRPDTTPAGVPLYYARLTNVPGDSVFRLANIGPEGVRYYCQLLVQEMLVPPAGSPVPTGRWAASRGTWFRVAP